MVEGPGKPVIPSCRACGECSHQTSAEGGLSMPRLACPHCKNIIVAGEEQRGSVVQCGQCQKRVKVPAARTPPSSPAGERPASWLAPAKAAEEKRPQPASWVSTPAEASRPPRPEKATTPASDDDDDEIASPDERSTNQPKKHAAGETRKKKKKRPPKTGVIVGILSGLGALLVLAAFILVISGKWVDWIREPLQKFLEEQGIHPLLAIGV